MEQTGAGNPGASTGPRARRGSLEDSISGDNVNDNHNNTGDRLQGAYSHPRANNTRSSTQRRPNDGPPPPPSARRTIPAERYNPRPIPTLLFASPITRESDVLSTDDRQTPTRRNDFRDGEEDRIPMLTPGVNPFDTSSHSRALPLTRPAPSAEGSALPSSTAATVGSSSQASGIFSNQSRVTSSEAHVPPLTRAGLLSRETLPEKEYSFLARVGRAAFSKFKNHAEDSSSIFDDPVALGGPSRSSGYDHTPAAAAAARQSATAAASQTLGYTAPRLDLGTGSEHIPKRMRTHSPTRSKKTQDRDSNISLIRGSGAGGGSSSGSSSRRKINVPFDLDMMDDTQVDALLRQALDQELLAFPEGNFEPEETDVTVEECERELQEDYCTEELVTFEELDARSWIYESPKVQKSQRTF